jgi:hypothetical protein
MGDQIDLAKHMTGQLVTEIQRVLIYDGQILFQNFEMKSWRQHFPSCHPFFTWNIGRTQFRLIGKILELKTTG